MIRVATKQELERDHEILLAMMHPYFGLSSKPDPIKIEIDQKKARGGFFYWDPLKINIAEMEKTEMEFTLAHEGGHYLHFLNGSQLTPSASIFPQFPIPMWREFLAQLSATLFFLETDRVYNDHSENEIYQLVGREYTYKNISKAKAKLKIASQIPEVEINRMGSKKLLEIMMSDSKLEKFLVK